MNAKSILQSRTFWANILGAAAELAGILPATWAAPVMMVVNIALRAVTNQPVTLSFLSK